MKPQIYAILIVILILAACSPQQPASDINPERTKAVLEHHWEAFRDNDLEEVMKDYTEESVLITPDATYRGLDEIRQNFIQAFEAFPADQSVLTLQKSVVEKDVGYILWQAETSSFNLVFATDTFIIRGGKIIRQTYGGITEAQLGLDPADS